MKEELSTSVVQKEDKEMVEKANEIFSLFQDAIKAGFSISFTPEQLKLLVEICESGYLYKPEKQ